MNNIWIRVIFPLILFLVLGFVLFQRSAHQNSNTQIAALPQTLITPTPLDPLTIQAMREKSYPGSDITIEQTLPDGSNYHQYIASYISDGLKIYGLLTIPEGDKPKTGWPVIIFNHGYIQPNMYQTFPQVGQYATYFPVFARAGYIVFKPDYRGNAQSQGQPTGAYYSPNYATDDLNAIASMKKFKDPSTGSGPLADPNRFGIWGHSMGGNITLRTIVVHPHDVKAAVIWGGVVGSYTDLEHWHDPHYIPAPTDLALRNQFRNKYFKDHGTPETNPTFWNSVDPTNFVNDIAIPVQLHAGEADEEVPLSFPTFLYNKLVGAGKTAEFYTYPGADHNISQGFDLAMQRSLAFFDKYVKESK